MLSFDMSVDAVVCWAIGLLLAGFVALMGFALYQDSQRDKEWECIASHQMTHLQPMVIGKVLVLVPMTITVCDEYRRRAP